MNSCYLCSKNTKNYRLNFTEAGIRLNKYKIIHWPNICSECKKKVLAGVIVVENKIAC